MTAATAQAPSYLAVRAAAEAALVEETGQEVSALPDPYREVVDAALDAGLRAGIQLATTLLATPEPEEPERRRAERIRRAGRRLTARVPGGWPR